MTGHLTTTFKRPCSRLFVPSQLMCLFYLCFQSSDLSFGFVGGSRFDSPEGSKLWNSRVGGLIVYLFVFHLFFVYSSLNIMGLLGLFSFLCHCL